MRIDAWKVGLFQDGVVGDWKLVGWEAFRGGDMEPLTLVAPVPSRASVGAFRFSRTPKSRFQLILATMSGFSLTPCMGLSCKHVSQRQSFCKVPARHNQTTQDARPVFIGPRLSKINSPKYTSYAPMVDVYEISASKGSA